MHLGKFASLTLSQICTEEYASEKTPSIQGLSDIAVVSAKPHYGYVQGHGYFTESSDPVDFCEVYIRYTHPDTKDNVTIGVSLPEPQNFRKRWLSTGGGGFSIGYLGNHTRGALEGLSYGAASSYTDGGFDSRILNAQPAAPGKSNDHAVAMFSHQAHDEMRRIGTAFTRAFYGMAPDEKLYTYFLGCSEGGREAMSQVQRFGEHWDGAIAGAPAMWYGHIASNLLLSPVLEKLHGFANRCELSAVVRDVIEFCDPLDGRSDNVVARSDLCKKAWSPSKSVGKSYKCGNDQGTVSQKAAELAKAIWDGLVVDGAQKYYPTQLASTFDYAKAQNKSGHVTNPLYGLGTEWVQHFLRLQPKDKISTSEFEKYSLETLVEFSNMSRAMYPELETDIVDLSALRDSQGKIMIIHGEADPLIPSSSSSTYFDHVRREMYGALSESKGFAALRDFFRLYFVPGGAHCEASSHQSGSWPSSTFTDLINWVESGRDPGSIAAGKGYNLCSFPARPQWDDGEFRCVDADPSPWIYDIKGLVDAE